MLRTGFAILCLLTGVSACSNYEPREKVATYDPKTDELTLPYPCPDWSQPQTHNYINAPHSNFGCAVNNNLAVQLDNPRDLYEGHGTNGMDLDNNDRVIQLYRAGTLPQPLTPLQSAGTGGSSGQ